MLRIVKSLPVGAVAVAIIFLLIQCICALYLPYLTADIVDNGVINGDTPYILETGIWMIVLSIVSLTGAVINTLISSRISYKLGGELREEIYRKVLQFSKNEFDKFGPSSLITRNTNDVTQVQNLVEIGLKFLIVAPIYLIGSIFFTYLLSPLLSLIFIAIIPFIAAASYVIYRFASPLYEKIQRLLDNLNSYYREGFIGARVIRAFNREDHEYEKFRSVNTAYTETSIKAGTIMSLFVPLVTMVVSLATVLIAWFGGMGVAAGTMEIGTIMAAISYSAQVLLGFALLTSVILAIPRGQISANRIHEVLDMPLSIKDPDNAISSQDQKPELTFENVDFRYPGAEKKTLENINFTVNAGQSLAIIGSTGDGKSSLVNLISRLYDVDKGCIKINGTDVRCMEQKRVHDLVSLSPQKSTLFMGTIRSNMLLGKPDATDDEIWKALSIAHATEFINTLDRGLDSRVERNGGNFSGGQKQRLCIARALLKDADIYVFDDSFSALDFKTDAKVRSDMVHKLKTAITVIVAQRISTIIDADIIAVLDKGKIVGLGNHDELKKSNRVYQEIINSQVYKQEAAA
jgi:ABC-type multidrug transport system fused ATPase/permease subunit